MNLIRHAALAFLTLSAGAALAAPPGMPTPAPEMKHLAFFDGDWTCTGTISPSPMGPGGKITGTVRAATELGGFWQTGRVNSTMDGMGSMEGTFHVTYDPAAKQFVMLWVDSMGGRSQASSPGWDGDRMVYSGEGSMGGQKMLTRDVFTKNADGSMRHTWEGQVDGKWVPMGDETCRKGSARN